LSELSSTVFIQFSRCLLTCLLVYFILMTGPVQRK